MRSKFKRSVAILVAVLSLGLVGATVVATSSEPAPASAQSACRLDQWFPYQAHRSGVAQINPNNLGNYVSKAGCVGIKLNGTPSAYWFTIAAQDIRDTTTIHDPQSQNDDQGVMAVEWRTPCSGCTNPWVQLTADKWSNDFNEAWYTSPTFNTAIHGPPEGFSFRFPVTFHWTQKISPWSGYVWQWGSNYNQYVTGIWYRYF